MMPSPFVLDALQWAITLSGVVAFVLASASWHTARSERQALLWSGQNGAMKAATMLHLITASTRAVAALLSMMGGVALILLPDFSIISGVVAGACWLAYNLLMTTNLVAERWAHGRMAVSLAGQERLSLVDELALQRIERTAERLERTAERLERMHERKASA